MIFDHQNVLILSMFWEPHVPLSISFDMDNLQLKILHAFWEPCMAHQFFYCLYISSKELKDKN